MPKAGIPHVFNSPPAGASMVSFSGEEKRPAIEFQPGVKRRRLLTFGALVTGFSALSSLGASRAEAAPKVQSPPTAYIPVTEKGIPNGVAILDTDCKIPRAQLPDLSATYATKAQVTRVQYTGALTKLRAGLATRNVAPVPLVFTGSSTTEGVGASAPSRRYVDVLTKALQNAYPMNDGSISFGVRNVYNITNGLPLPNGIQAFNIGIGGAASDTYLNDFNKPRIVSLAPRAIFHMVGSNDAWLGRPVATYKAQMLANIDYFKAKLTGPCVHILVHQHLRWDKATLYPWSDYGQALREIAETDPENIAFIDVSEDFALVGVPNSDPLNLVNQDNIHLSDAGYSYLADLLLGKLGVAAPMQYLAPGAKVRATSDSFTGATAGSFFERSSDAVLGGSGEKYQASVINAFGISAGHLVPGVVAADSFLALPRPAGSVEVGANIHDVSGATIWLVPIRDALAAPLNQVRLAITAAGAQITYASAGTTAALGVIHPFTRGRHWAIRVTGTEVKVLLDGAVLATETLPKVISGTYSGIARASTTVFDLNNFTIDSYVG